MPELSFLPTMDLFHQQLRTDNPVFFAWRLTCSANNPTAWLRKNIS